MTEFINENPNVLDETQLPQRLEDPEDWLDSSINKTTLEKKKQLLKISSNDPQLISDIEILDKLLARTKVSEERLPDLAYDEETQDPGSEEYCSFKEDEDLIDPQEIYDLISHISDPEHPLTLGQLAVVNLPDIEVHNSDTAGEIAEVVVRITPTITHCSLATLIGLGIRVRLERSLTPRFRITILLKEGSHQSENQVNKQLNDKERVAAACENEQLIEVVSKMLSTCK
ncbi:iron-sulfur cluster assembly protein CIA2 Ecym_8191 [Eremothecium cymbalariae DBVPG|uniref:Uncharacterized protein n=1 Tax=Eremothecium cymbalariae (strain CBS 270.75 / DBVPG 7215 / KCTC 17166 / NRRL Y-17582) TaxID=931890 RepID=G8JXA2_ERECY|nr:Hypothetical protein Ecym_8191 [Eremothecium cymbalariae DBVPG\